jgi:PAS domain S-box-containing protein
MDPMKPRDILSRPPIQMAVLGVLYFALGWLTIELPSAAGLDAIQRVIWLPSGIALAAFLLVSPRLWPGVAAGAFCVTLATGGSLVFALGTAVGNSVEPLVGWLLLRRLTGFRNDLERVLDVLALVLFGAIVGPFVGSLISVAALDLAGGIPPDAGARIWWVWWLTHILGVLTVTPFLVVLAARGRGTGHSLRSLEGVLLYLALFAFGLLVFRDAAARTSTQSPLDYTPFPFLIWSAFRFGPKGAASTNLLIAAMAIWGAVAGLGPFGAGPLDERLLLTGLFIAVMTITTLLLGAVLVQGKRAEEARLTTESRYRMLVEQAADGIFITDANGRILDVNSSGLEMLGYTRRELLMKSVQDLFVPGEGEGLGDVVEALTRGRIIRSEWTLVREDGAQVPIEISAKRLEDGRLQGIVRDVSERKALESQLAQSQKMEAVGMLAGGVAHDFNNLLTAIMGHADFAEESLAEGDPARADLVEVRRGAQRAAELTRQLLAFARKQIVAPKIVVLDDLVANVEKMLRRVIGADVELEVHRAGEGTRVRVDPVQMEQVLLNLSINAREAMPKGGTLAIRTGLIRVDRGAWDQRFPGVSPGRWAILTVKDTGVGMDPEILARIFEPFFTTKGRSKGTGLGLATSYGIVRQAGGHIFVDSKPSKGSEFRILLPVTDQPADVLPVPEERGGSDAREDARGETVLVVEDEPVVLDLANKVLSERGYRVLRARDGEEALEVAKAFDGEIHLSLTDIMLPRISGKVVAERLRVMRPGIRVLFMSGYAEDQVVHDGELEEGIAFLPKPFTPDVLVRRVRAALDEAPREPVEAPAEGSTPSPAPAPGR